MTGHLFQSSWHYYWDLVLRLAVDDVQRLDRMLFLGSDLARELEAIAERYSLDIAQLDEAGIKIKRRKNEHIRLSSQHERRGWMEVIIPFIGDADSLRIAPSVCTIPRHFAEIDLHTLTIMIRDGETAVEEIDECIGQIRWNLGQLRKDYCNGKTQLERTIAQVAGNREMRIKDEDWGRVAGRLRRLI